MEEEDERVLTQNNIRKKKKKTKLDRKFCFSRSKIRLRFWKLEFPNFRFENKTGSDIVGY